MTSLARVCTFEGCGRKMYAKKYCSMHYQRDKAGKPLGAPKLGTARLGTCKIPTCGRGIRSRGLCVTHYNRSWKGWEVDTPIAEQKPSGGACAVTRCGSIADCRGYCHRHYKQVKNYNLTPELEKTLLVQETCDICQEAVEVIHIDHDHSCCPDRGRSCGKCIRGGLCRGCNTGIGMFEDNPEKMLRAIKYLRKSEVC